MLEILSPSRSIVRRGSQPFLAKPELGSIAPAAFWPRPLKTLAGSDCETTVTRNSRFLSAGATVVSGRNDSVFWSVIGIGWRGGGLIGLIGRVGLIRQCLHGFL